VNSQAINAEAKPVDANGLLMTNTANHWIGCSNIITLIITLICRVRKHANEGMMKEKHRQGTVYGIRFKTEWLHKPLKLLLAIARGKLTRKRDMYLAAQAKALAQAEHER
jgi:hypothetical protein